ncbi:PLP-dependent aminotransferase family protein [Hyalangium rubrum]|uniref:PLP-dependent aminotransferase family protein n=1 Tax=Hyalangium rubrum TaxID=3103134 RepID=A0ABU5H1L9_9BACT|nr:PLP-dependent aminotransferase family protein [Hyalangium sp. s54d21]MDY7226677.1 PLP-dependent aminotransferase family protein [Hyalangium sp. s54d21]
MTSRRPRFQPSIRRQGSHPPLHVQLYDRIRQAILAGTLPPGARLPSARAMALETRVARGTVDVAYARLTVEGFLVTRGAAGTFVASPLPLSPREGAPVPPKPRQVEPRARTVLWPFQVGVPAVDAFPIATWSRVLGRHSRRARASELAHSDTRGDASLREAIAAHLAVSRGVIAHAEDVMVTGGYHSALGLLAHALSKPGDPVWMEDPGYHRARAALSLAGLRPVAVPVDAEGLEVSRGVALAPRARFAFVTPSHQMPLGMALSLARRLALLDWARSADAWIVEDDYDGEFHYASAPLPALKSLDDKGLVLYAGTFSKSMFPTLRLGFLVVPDRAREALGRAANLLHPAPPLAVQRAVADFLDEGHYARHVRRMRTLYGERRAALLRALTELSSPHLQVEAPPGGLHLLARLSGIRDEAVVTHAEGLGLGLNALSGYQFSPAVRRLDGLVLGFATLPATRARDAVSRLARALELAR